MDGGLSGLWISGTAKYANIQIRQSIARNTNIQKVQNCKCFSKLLKYAIFDFDVFPIKIMTLIFAFYKLSQH